MMDRVIYLRANMIKANLHHFARKNSIELIWSVLYTNRKNNNLRERSRIRFIRLDIKIYSVWVKTPKPPKSIIKRAKMSMQKLKSRLLNLNWRLPKFCRCLSAFRIPSKSIIFK
jgi:hypothetical protein